LKALLFALLCTIAAGAFAEVRKEVRLESEPQGAQVFLLRGTQRVPLGITPFAYEAEFHSEMSILRLRFERTGYEGKTLELKAAQDRVVAALDGVEFLASPDVHKEEPLKRLQEQVNAALSGALPEIYSRAGPWRIDFAGKGHVRRFADGRVYLHLPFSMQYTDGKAPPEEAALRGLALTLWDGVVRRLASEIWAKLAGAGEIHGLLLEAQANFLDRKFAVGSRVESRLEMECIPGTRERYDSCARQVAEYSTDCRNGICTSRQTGTRCEGGMKSVYDACATRAPVTKMGVVISPTSRVGVARNRIYYLAAAGVTADAEFGAPGIREVDDSGRTVFKQGNVPECLGPGGCKEAPAQLAGAQSNQLPASEFPVKRFGDLMRQAEAAIHAGNRINAISLLERALSLAEEGFGKESVFLTPVIDLLGASHQGLAQYPAAARMYERSLAISESSLGSEHKNVVQSLNDLAGVYRRMGQYAKALPLQQRTLAIREKSLGPEHADVATSLNNVALLYYELGEYAQALPFYQRSLAIQEKVHGPEHGSVATTLNNLATLYRNMGQYAQALPLYQRALALDEKASGPEHQDVATSLNNLAMLYDDMGEYAKALPLYQRSLAIFEKVLGPEHPDVATSLNNLALLYVNMGEYAKALPLYQRSLAISEKILGPEHPLVATTLNNLAELYQLTGEHSRAVPLSQRDLAISEKALGPDHPHVASSLNYLARLYRLEGRIDDGLQAARRSSAILSQRYTRQGRYERRRNILTEQRTNALGFEQYVALLADDVSRKPAMHVPHAAEGFQVVQLARASDTAEQVARMAARFAAGTDALARLVRQRQDIIARAEELDATLLREVSKSAAQRDARADQRLREEQATVRRKIADLGARLEREFPQYRDLVDLRPLALDAAQKLLGEDEALVLLLVSSDESFLWVLRREDAGFFRLTLKRTELVEIVKKLRAQLDLGSGVPESVLSRPFDVATAYGLYRKILAPAEALLVGAKQLIFVPDGAMQSLPPGLLVTELPAKPTASLAELARVPWLAKKYAITVLPAVGSLRALRQFAKAHNSQEPFSGYGDPVLGGSGEGARRTNVAALYSRGVVADANEVRKLARLPESAGELRAIAAALKAPAESVRLGADATERAVKEANLSRYRNLAFATHGLMAGDFRGLAEPALVLTPPQTGSELDDGLLTAGEISQLKLDADLVVLSACNTAAPDGTPGAEGLSGLARAFFYAGAKSLLVSHWSVSSDAAVALTTGMFDESAKGLSKAEALRRSMLSLMARTDNPYFAHPALWAPFVLVGEGNTGWGK